MLSAKERIALLTKSDTIVKAERKVSKIFPTRIIELNNLLPGGWVGGKVCLIWGPPSSGKSSIAVEAIADAQKANPEHVSLLIPAERGEDINHYINLGLDPERTVVMQKKRYILEECLEELEDYLMKGLVNSVLIDSWDGLIGYKEIFTPDGKTKEAIKDSVAVKAAGAAKMLKRIKGLIFDQEILCLIIAQVRTQGLGSYVVTEGFAGGNALKHFIEIELYQGHAGLIREKVDDHQIVVGQTIKFKLTKSKVNSNVHKSVEVPYYFEKRWDNVEGVFTSALALGIITKGGAWYNYEGFEGGKIQGIDDAKAFFEDPKILAALQKQVETKISANASVEPADVPVEAEPESEAPVDEPKTKGRRGRPSKS